jgi:hypothetical protein
MTDGSAGDLEAGRLRSLHRWLARRTRGQLLAAGLVVAAVVAAIAVAPGARAPGTFTEAPALELGAAASPALASTGGGVSEDADGYRVAPGRRATVTVPLRLPQTLEGRTLLRIWAYGPASVTTTIDVISPDGQRTLGRPGNWVGETFDVTDEARRGLVRLRATSENASTQSALFLDRIAPISAPDSAIVTASAWPVAVLVLLAAAAALAVAGRLRRHWPLPLLLGATAALLWPPIAEKSLEPLAADVLPTWNAATAASWSGFHDGLVSGSWTSLSSLAVQVFHAFTPLVGPAPVSARSASLLAALLALAAIYAFGYRAAGRTGALVATGVAAACAPFRDAVIAGSPLPVLVLAAALFGYALHAALARATPLAITLLGGGAALLALAEPTWLPGAFAVVAIVALVCGEPGARCRVLRIGVLTTAVLLTPHLASTASQHDGSLLANMSARAIAARNVEFLGAGHGSATPLQLAQDPLSGRPVTLPGYVLGDHSVSQVIGSVLAGGQESLAAFGTFGLLGVVATILWALGALYALVLPRLRLLVLLPPLVVAPTLFIAGRTGAEPLTAGAALWPALLVAGGILAYALAHLARPIVEPRAVKLRHVRSRVVRPRREPAAQDG